MKITYTKQGDYLLPDLVLPPQSASLPGRYGRLHKEYLQKYKKGTYSGLFISGKLMDYLAEIDKQAQEMHELLMKQLAEKENIPEDLKARDQMAWVGAMNNIKMRVEEIVLHDLIYT